MQNFKTLGQPLLGEKYVAQKKEKNNPKNSGHFVPQRTHSARTNEPLVVEAAYKPVKGVYD